MSINVSTRLARVEAGISNAIKVTVTFTDNEIITVVVTMTVTVTLKFATITIIVAITKKHIVQIQLSNRNNLA